MTGAQIVAKTQSLGRGRDGPTNPGLTIGPIPTAKYPTFIASSLVVTIDGTSETNSASSSFKNASSTCPALNDLLNFRNADRQSRRLTRSGLKLLPHSAQRT